jgi:hypothetical protein
MNFMNCSLTQCVYWSTSSVNTAWWVKYHRISRNVNIWPATSQWEFISQNFMFLTNFWQDRDRRIVPRDNLLTVWIQELVTSVQSRRTPGIQNWNCLVTWFSRRIFYKKNCILWQSSRRMSSGKFQVAVLNRLWDLVYESECGPNFKDIQTLISPLSGGKRVY